MKTLTLLVLLTCGTPPAAELVTTSAEVHLVDAGVAPWCHCCWPAELHGPNRCRFTRAASAPPDVCESDPAQRCVTPDAGASSGAP